MQKPDRASGYASPSEIAAAINAHSIAAVGTPRALVDANGDLRLARYVRDSAIWALDGHAAGFHTSDAPYVVHEIGIFGTSPILLRWAEERARGELALAPEGVRVVTQAMVLEADAPTRQLLEDAGYTVARVWSHLAIEMTAPPPEPAWPDGISVEPFDPAHDWPAAGAAMDEAFVDHWGALPLTEDMAGADDEEAEGEEDEEDDPYSNSRAFCFVARAGREVAGVLLGNERTVEWPDSGKVGSATVRRPFRRRGLATALLFHALGAFERQGTRRVITDTDAASFTAGPILYERVGMREYRRELVYERELRPGRELRTLARG